LGENVNKVAAVTVGRTEIDGDNPTCPVWQKKDGSERRSPIGAWSKGTMGLPAAGHLGNEFSELFPRKG